MTVIEHRTTTEACPRCLLIRPRLTPERTAARIDWDVLTSARGLSGRPVRLRCGNGHDTEDSAELWLWLGERGF